MIMKLINIYIIVLSHSAIICATAAKQIAQGTIPIANSPPVMPAISNGCMKSERKNYGDLTKLFEVFP